MKTFIAALVLTALIITAVSLNTYYVVKKADSLLAMVEAFPTSADEAETVWLEIANEVEAFSNLWDQAMPSLAYTSSYDNLNRADEAAILLFASYQNGNAADFIAARYDFLDALRRLRSLEAISLSSLF